MIHHMGGEKGNLFNGCIDSHMQTKKNLEFFCKILWINLHTYI